MKVSSDVAGQLLGGLSREIINQYVRKNLLPADRIGTRKILKIRVNDIREFAKSQDIFFDESLATKLTAEETVQ